MDKKTNLLLDDEFAWVEWMKAERIKKQWSQTDLANEAHTTRQTINDYESKRRTKPDEKILGRISVALGYPADHLLRIARMLPPEPVKDETLYRIEHLYHTLKEDNNKTRALEFLEFLSQQEGKNDDRKGKKSK